MALDLSTQDNGDIVLRVPRQIAPKYTQELDNAYERIANYTAILRELYESETISTKCTLDYLFKNNGVTHADLGIDNSHRVGFPISNKETGPARPIIICAGCEMPVTNCCCEY